MTGNLTSRFSRGKTAQTGRNIDLEEGLPTIGIKSPDNANFYGRNQSNSFKVKTPSHGINVGAKLRNNLMGHQKGESWGVPQYGNLMKLNTIDDQSSNPMLKTDAEFMNNKRFADLRLQAGKKKCVPDKYVQKVVNKQPDAHDVESVPSEVGDDQWAEINNYDYQLYQQQKQKEKDDDKKKRNLVRNTLSK